MTTAPRGAEAPFLRVCSTHGGSDLRPLFGPPAGLDYGQTSPPRSAPIESSPSEPTCGHSFSARARKKLGLPMAGVSMSVAAVPGPSPRQLHWAEATGCKILVNPSADQIRSVVAGGGA